MPQFSSDQLDALFKFVSTVVSLGSLTVLVKIFVRIGAAEQWIKTTDKEVASHGSMLQQLTKSVSRIEGRMENAGRHMDAHVDVVDSRKDNDEPPTYGTGPRRS